jgi:hypothetical protein
MDEGTVAAAARMELGLHGRKSKTRLEEAGLHSVEPEDGRSLAGRSSPVRAKIASPFGVRRRIASVLRVGHSWRPACSLH